MAKNITLMGANYPDVPAVVLPKTGGGSATFVDADEIGSVEEAIAIVVNGNTAPKAISIGQYLFIKNHSTLATGGYHATAAIASGGAVSSSNVSADPDGIANSINNQLGNFVTGPSSVTSGTIPLYDGTTGKAIKAGKSITDKTASTAIGNNANIPTNRTVYNAIYNGLDKTAAGFALDARQGKTLDDKAGTLSFGDSNTILKTVLSNNWTSAVPNDGYTHFCNISCQYGNVMGIISRYSTGYGMMIGARYEGSIYLASLNNGTVTLWNLNNAKTESTA